MKIYTTTVVNPTTREVCELSVRAADTKRARIALRENLDPGFKFLQNELHYRRGVVNVYVRGNFPQSLVARSV